MADQGMHTLDELVGRSDLLEDDHGRVAGEAARHIDIIRYPGRAVSRWYYSRLQAPKSVLDKAMDAQTAEGNMARSSAGKRPDM